MRKFCLIFIFTCITLEVSLCQEQAETARKLYLEYQESRDEGDFSRAEILLKRILAGGFRLPDYNRALVHNALGFVYYETGALEKALRQYRTAEYFSKGTDPGSIDMRIGIYNNIALLRNSQGDYISALDHYDKALRLLDSVRISEERYFSLLSMLQFNKGIAYYRLESWQEAFDILKESERIKEAHGLTYLGSVYFNLARVCQNLGEPCQAEKYYHRAIGRWIAEHDTGYYQLANIYLHFGEFLVDQGQTDRGYRYMQKALQNYLANYGRRHPLTSDCYEKLAGYHLDRSDYRRALEFVQLALISVTGSFNDRNIFTNPSPGHSLHDLTLLKCFATKARALEGFAQVESPGQPVENREKKLELLQAALETNRLSIELLQHLQGSYPTRENRIYFTSGQKELFSTGISLNLQLFTLTGNESCREAAFLVAAAGKSFELIYEMKEKELLYLKTLPDSLAGRVLELKQQMDHISNQIQLESQELQPDSAKLVRWKEQLFFARLTYQQHMDLLRQDHPRIEQFETVESDFSMEQIRRHLGKKETLVEYFLSDADRSGSRKATLFAVTRHNCRVHQSTIDSSFYRDLNVVLKSLHGFDPYGVSIRSTDSLKMALFNLYRQLIQPVESVFKGKSVIIVPHEELAYLPFDALINRYEPETSLNFTAWPCLVHSYDISYLYNSQLIDSESNPGMRLPPLIAWVPDYSGSGKGSLRYLMGASEEVEEILKITKGRRIHGSTGKSDAGRILEEDAVLHLAMHTLTPNPAGGSAAFLLKDEEDSIQDNRLHDYEINALALISPMVVLSSCESGSGRLERGEGIMSFSRSFLLAGAESVVHTLWPVDDAKGPRLMVEFYREMKRGYSKSRSLSRAKKTYLAGTPPTYAHPYYWAAYQVTGNPSRLALNRNHGMIFGGCILFSMACYFLIRRSFFRRS